ncbi:MAG: efflux RND transporter periplasmic adaptor subunit [Bacteroidales bacterium]|nr:efflux RND transporter periplasmic adaptor subunit [Bacteroidales bacterium]
MKKLFRGKRWIIWTVALLFILLIILAVGKKNSSGEIRVTMEKVERRTLVETVSANGKIQPETEVKISPYISGEVVELYVHEGDQVKVGDLLAKIDPEIYISSYERTEASLEMQRANLANARARLAQAKAQFVKAEEDYKRNRQLWEQKVISDADYESVQASFNVAREEVSASEENVKAAEFTVNSAQASLKEARENLTRTTITSPNNGVVSRLSVEKGERVTGASQFSPGTEIMRIANLDRMVVNVEVNENDIVRVSLNDTCLIEVDAYLKRKFKGIVTEIATSANTTGVSADQVTNFEVKVLILTDSYHDLVNPEDPIQSPFRPGMSATVDIQTETSAMVLTVPIQAVTTRQDTTMNEMAANENEDETKEEETETPNAAALEDYTEYIFTIREGKANRVEVTTGIQDNMYIEITEGLSEGDEVITGPYRVVSKTLKDGDPVVVVDKKELFGND